MGILVTLQVQNGAEGQIKCPSPDKRAPGVPVTLWLPKEAVKNPGKGGDQPSAREALPWGSLSRGAGSDVPLCPLRRERLLGLSRKKCAAAKTKRGKQKPGTRSNEAPLPPRVQKNGASEGGRVISAPPSTERIQKSPKRPGPRMAPRQNARKKGRTAKTGDKPGAAGTKTRKGTRTQSACGACPVTT